ncbi:hypothetical protein E8E14_006358 [Neopestalotiopsis sp. 37M]|nr:hypothetical protein E8E14_006358 [Neopestalotiopsis sp. 37M]
MSPNYGLHRVWPPKDLPHQSGIDIIAIHGLGTNSPKTWQAWEDTSSPSDRESRSINWLQDEDMLPASIPDCNIWTYDWNGDYCVDAPVETLLGQAQEFLQSIESKILVKEKIRPIIIVASCFGGLVTIKAITSALAQQADFGRVLQSIVGILFLAAPLKGTSMKKLLDWQLLISTLMGRQVSDRLYKDLEADTGVLQDLVYSFTLCANGGLKPQYRIPLFCFYETQRTQWLKAAVNWKPWKSFSNKFPGDILVPYENATLDGFPNGGLKSNHTMMCKYRGPSDVSFQAVVFQLCKMKDKSSLIMSERTNLGRETISTLPRPLNSLFTGQTKVVDRITAALRQGCPTPGQRKIFVVTGPGGMGKSEVCLQVAHEMLHEFWGIFWVDGSSRATAENGYVTAVSQFDKTPKSIEEACRRLAKVSHKWLLILDNADDFQLNYSDLLPPGQYGSVLITLRNPDCKEYQTVGHVQLSGLDDHNATELLLSLSGIENTESEFEDAKTLAKSLHGHPLAIKQAGTYIKLFCNRCCQYPGIFSQQQLSSKSTQGHSRYAHVYETFETSIKALDLIDASDAQDARDFFAFLSRMDHSALPLEFFKAVTDGFSSRDTVDGGFGAVTSDMLATIPRWLHSCTASWDNPHLRNAISALSSLGLILVEQRRGWRCLSIHPLIHGWARVYFSTAPQTPRLDYQWLTTGITLSLLSQSRHRWEGWEMDLRPHLHSFLQSDNISIDEVCRPAPANVIFNCVKLLLAIRDERMTQKMMELLFSSLHADQTSPTMELLPLYDLQALSEERGGHRASAKQLYEKIIPLKVTKLGPDHPDCLKSRHSLAIAARGIGDVTLAISELQEVLEQRKARCAEDDPDLLTTYLDLARLLILQGQLLIPIHYLERVVSVLEKHSQPNNLLRLHSRHELARAYLKTVDRPGCADRSSEAIKILEDVSAIEKSILSEDDSQRLSTLHALAKAYLATGKSDDALSILLDIVRVQDTCLAPGHPTSLATLFELGRAYRINGQASEAIRTLHGVVESRKLETPNHRGHGALLAAQHELAEAFFAAGNSQRSRELAEYVLQTRQQALSKGHPQIRASQDLLDRLNLS